MTKIFIVIGCIIFLMIVCWFLGGSRVNEIQTIAKQKAIDICGEKGQIIYQGYERNIFGGFGGRVWYQCDINNIWYQFAITTRLENRVPQVYNFQQMTTFPNNFQVK